MERYPNNDRYKEFIWNDELGSYEMIARPMVAMCSDDTYEYDGRYALKSAWSWANFFDAPYELRYATTEEWQATLKDIDASCVTIHLRTTRVKGDLVYKSEGSLEGEYPLSAKQDTVKYAPVSPRQYYYVNYYNEKEKKWIMQEPREMMTLSKSGDVWKALQRPQSLFGRDPAVYPTGCTGQSAKQSVTGLCEEIFGGTFNGFGGFGIYTRGLVMNDVSNWKFDDWATFDPDAKGDPQTTGNRPYYADGGDGGSSTVTPDSISTAKHSNGSISISTMHTADDGTITDGFE